MGRVAHCDTRVSADSMRDMDRTSILLWIVALIVLEIYHLKWIWWLHWDCRRCHAKHQHCGCGAPKWQLYL